MSGQPAVPPLADAGLFVKEMAKVANTLAADLSERARDPRIEPSLKVSWAQEQKAGQTGEAFEVWRGAFCDQVSASWVLCAVFARTLEDRGLLQRRIAGPGADDKLAQFKSQFRFLSERDYLLHIFESLSLLPAGREVFGRGHAPLWRMSPTNTAVTGMLDVLRSSDGDALRFSFGRPEGTGDDGATTRFLGDLYQDLNKAVRKRFALLQTPTFVERFILDQTLTHAIAERGVGVTMIDPACGSGHFLLGAYDRMFEARMNKEPGSGREAAARQALSQVYGVDLNPYAAAIARFRLLVSYLDKAVVESLHNVGASLPIKVFVGDSLLAGKVGVGKGATQQFTFGDQVEKAGGDADEAGFERGLGFSFLEPTTDAVLRASRFDVVVGNPPYINESDDRKREIIREAYAAAVGKFALSAPFIERLFELGNEGAWIGQITANTFMRRNFGRVLVQDVLPKLDLTAVMDTSGAFIPGHAHTNTVLLFGRQRAPLSANTRVVMATRGEPGVPEVAEEGHVWSTIARHHAEPGYEDDYISVVDLPREKLHRHPWSIGGGGAAELKETMDERAAAVLGSWADSIGFMAITGEDDAFLAPKSTFAARGIEQPWVRRLGTGDTVRDWAINDERAALFPYPSGRLPDWDELPREVGKWLWVNRRILLGRPDFGGKKYIDVGRTAHEYHQIPLERLKTPLTIAYAEIATHNHFVLDRGDFVFNQTAPTIKLAADADEESYVLCTAILNSSSACFWLNQVCQPKTMGNASGANATPFLVRRQYSATKLGAFPLPAAVWEDDSLIRAQIVAIARELTALGRDLEYSRIAQIFGDDFTNAAELRALWRALKSVRADARRRAILLQECLDWAIYAAFGFIKESSLGPLLDGFHGLDLGQRPFEVYGAKRADPLLQEWARWHQFSPTTSPDLSEPVASFVRSSVDAIGKAPPLQLLEHPCHKRRWVQPRGKAAREPYSDEKAFGELLPEWLLQSVERELAALREHGRPITVRELARVMHNNPKVNGVAEEIAGGVDYDLEELLGGLMAKESVPSASCQAYTDTGIEARRTWELVWDQARSGADDQADELPVPTKFAQKDFVDASRVWRHRGKLDFPKERFISYPTATPPPGAEASAGHIFGWAGWNHLEQLQAATSLWQDEWAEHGQKILPKATRNDREQQLGDQAREDESLRADAHTREKLLPILQTMVDLRPWVRQWHNEDGETANAFETYVSEECRKVEMSLQEIHEYRLPEKKGRKKTAKKKAKVKVSEEDLLATCARLDTGEGAKLADLGKHLGTTGASLKKLVDDLVNRGKLVETKKRPRTLKVEAEA